MLAAHHSHAWSRLSGGGRRGRAEEGRVEDGPQAEGAQQEGHQRGRQGCQGQHRGSRPAHLGFGVCVRCVMLCIKLQPLLVVFGRLLRYSGVVLRALSAPTFTRSGWYGV